MRNIRAINLEPPVRYVVLFVRRDPAGWRFDGWKAAVGHTVPDEPPRATLGRVFPTPEAAAKFFTKVLTCPEDIVPPVPGLMPPAPKCDYYWPPSLEHCIEAYERDLAAQPKCQVPIRRVIILGAGFSADFGFVTSNSIVGGIESFFEKWQPSDWYRQRYQELRQWLDHKFPNWRSTSPPLYEFLDSFFPPRNPDLSRFVEASDPFVLFEQGISWEADNCAGWIADISRLPIMETYDHLVSFEALLAIYLLAGLMTNEVRTPWAEELFRKIEPTDVILTFNWDVIPETLMVGVETPFCRYDWTDKRTKLVKLHGSIDLLTMPNSIMYGDLDKNGARFECVTDMLWRARTAEDVLVRTGPWPLGRPLLPAERYNKSAILIMPPRYPLGYGYQLIQFNWRKARTALERAKEVYIVGYSMPDEDVAFRSLAQEVSEQRAHQVTVDVWNPDPMVGERAKRLFGEQRVTLRKEPASKFEFR